MRLLYLLNFFISFFSINNINSQPNSKNSNFVINGEIIGKDTGAVILWYVDSEHHHHHDTTSLKNGKFNFTGNANNASEGILWTDLKNKIFDHKTVLRFILEPGNISILCKGDDALHALVTGSKAQIEKQNWDKKKSPLTNKENEGYTTLQSNRHTIRLMDLNYISRHKNSYLSGYLLSHHKRRMSIDSLQFFYTALTKKIKQSNFGYDILSYLYPLTNDFKFRNKNPIFGLDFNTRLKNIKSIYNIRIPDTSGNKINIGIFKGQYLIIDFWASWCGPCIENIPFIKKLKEHYKNDSLQLISYSVDTDGNKWKAAIRKNNFSGLQVSDLNGFSGLLPVYCKLAIGVPTYMLFDKNGKLINTDLPQPGDSALNKILDKLFKN